MQDFARAKGFRKPARAVRMVAYALAVCWCSALFLCVAHCTLGIGQCGAGESKGGSCHGAGAHSDNGSNPRHEEAQTSLFCNAFEQGKINVHTIHLGISSPLVLYTVCEATALAEQLRADVAAVLRQQQRAPRVCTPEVYLGPALHSLAPPSNHS